MTKLDKKDCIILNMLQENCRTSLTDIAKRIHLSVDSTKKRIKKMENDIFYPRVQIRPRSLGFNNIVDVKIKFGNHSKKEIENLIKYLLTNSKVAELFSVSGEWDLSVVFISRNLEDQEKITSEIKNKFGNIINSWNESITLKAYKFEKYDMKKLLNFN